MTDTEAEKAAAFLERAAAMLPDPERPPSRYHSEAAALAAEHSRQALEYRQAMDAKLAAINRTERVVWILVVALAAGTMVAGYVNSVIGPPKQAEFLREKP